MFVYQKLGTYGRREAFLSYFLPNMVLYNSTLINLCKVGGPNWYWLKCDRFEFKEENLL